MNPTQGFAPGIRVDCENNWKHMFHSNGGIFYGDNSIVRVFPFTMFRLTLFFVISQALHRILRPFKQTHYVSKTLTGIILGPSVLGKYKRYEGITNIPSQVQFVNAMAYFGFLYYIFIIAVKTDSTMILRFRKPFWIMGTLSMFVSFIAMVVLVVILKPVDTLNVIVNTYIFPLEVSSTWFINLVPVLEELNLLTTEVGQLSLSLGLTNEIWMWTCAVLIIVAKTIKAGIGKIVLPLSVFFFVFMFIVIRPLILWVVKKLPRGQPVKDVYVVGTLLGAGVTACLSDAFVGSPLMGVVIIGLIVPHGPPLGLAIVERGEVFVKNCLLPFFFLAVGDSVTFQVLQNPGQVIYQIVIIIGYITKMVTTTLCAIWYNMSPRRAITLGLLMNVSGVVHIMVYYSQWIRQRTDSAIASQLVFSSLIATAIATPLASHIHKQSKKDRQSVRGFELSIQSAVLSSRLHILACVDTEDDIPGFINLIKASNPTNSHPICVYLLHLVELVGQAAPMLLPHKKHNRICKYNGCVQIMNAAKTYCDTSEGGVTIQLLTMIAPFTSMDESICKLAEDRMIPLIIVPFVYKSQVHLGKGVSGQLNNKLQQHSPCTLAIFVNNDKNSNKLKKSYFSYHVAVFFCGGEDDREALAYATRMSTHPGVSITLLRVFIQEYDTKNEAEIMLDNSAIDKFKAKVTNNACAIYKEYRVQEWLHTLDVAQSLEKTFDLIMIGRRHGKQASKLEDGLYILRDNPELGDIGELLICGDVEWENTSFLVMQHCLISDKETTGNTFLLDHSKLIL